MGEGKAMGSVKAQATSYSPFQLPFLVYSPEPSPKKYEKSIKKKLSIFRFHLPQDVSDNLISPIHHKTDEAKPQHGE